MAGEVEFNPEDEFLQAQRREDAQGEEDPFKGGRFAVESYLQHQGSKLVARFDPNSYIVLSEAMNHHDVGRGRGVAEQALSTVRAEGCSPARVPIS